MRFDRRTILSGAIVAALTAVIPHPQNAGAKTVQVLPAAIPRPLVTYKNC